jgi:hypothetical protein
MRESRCMSLLPRTTFHSDSEQFIYNWMLEDDLDLDEGNWRKLNGKQGNGQKSWKVFTQTIIGNCLCPGSRVGSRFSRKDTGETKEKGVMQKQVVLK